MYVYADALMLFNFIINSVIFLLTAWAVGISRPWWRICLGALLGSVYSLVEVFPEMNLFYMPGMKIVVSVFLILVVFGRSSASKTLLLVSIFYLVSFLLGGAVIGWLFFAQEGFSVVPGMESKFKPAWYDIAAGILVGAVILILLFKRLLSRADQRRSLYTALIDYDGRQQKFVALLDTGNSLHSTVGSRPVMLVDCAVIVKLVSPEVQDFLLSHHSEDWLTDLTCCGDQAWLDRVEVIPYRGVGMTDILLGFRPDNMIVFTPNGIIETTDVVVAIYNGTLSPTGRYSALLNGAIFRNFQFKKGASKCA